MNYLAHGIRFLDRPWFVAGTAAPDWLSVADRKVRLRERLLVPYRQSDDETFRDFVAGALQHLRDDDWFHESRSFYEITSGVADRFRKRIPPSDGFLPGFLGHIATEMLLDRLLMEREPGVLDAYYATLERIDPRMIQSFVNQICPRQTERLGEFVELFREIRFLEDYSDSASLFRRLNQVLRRVKLNPLPQAGIPALEDAWDLIQQRGWELLPPEHFPLEQRPRRTTR